MSEIKEKKKRKKYIFEQRATVAIMYDKSANEPYNNRGL